MSQGDDRVAGVERELIERYLVLVRDLYPKVDKANYYLERTDMSGVNVAITNQRDVLSHLVTLLTRTDMSFDAKQAQLTSAEEHFRRAIAESYDKALLRRTHQVLQLYKQYVARVVPLQNPSLPSSPSLQAVDRRIREVKALREEARQAKSWNTWDATFEGYVSKYVEAVEKINSLTIELEEYISKANHITNQRHSEQRAVAQTRENRTSRWLAIWGIVMTLVCTALGIWISILLVR